MKKNNTVLLQELYAETMTEQTILCAIQAHNIVQQPNSLNKNILLLSHANDYKNSVMQCAAYGFWGLMKKKCLFVLVDENEEVIIQNPRMVESLGKHFKNTLRANTYKTSTSSRIHKGVQKHLSYITLLTNIDTTSILHIPKTSVRDTSIHEYIQKNTNEDTLIVFLSNCNEDGLGTTEEETLTHTLYRKTIGENNENTDILQCGETKEIFGIMRKTNYLHIGA